MSNFILPTAHSAYVPVAAVETSVSALMIIAGVYVGIFAPILWQQYKASKST